MKRVFTREDPGQILRTRYRAYQHLVTEHTAPSPIRPAQIAHVGEVSLLSHFNDNLGIIAAREPLQPHITSDEELAAMRRLAIELGERATWLQKRAPEAHEVKPGYGSRLTMMNATLPLEVSGFSDVTARLDTVRTTAPIPGSGKNRSARHLNVFSIHIKGTTATDETFHSSAYAGEDIMELIVPAFRPKEISNQSAVRVFDLLDLCTFVENHYDGSWLPQQRPAAHVASPTPMPMAVAA